MQVWRRIRESLEKHRRAALISVVKVEGSAPREMGARMDDFSLELVNEVERAQSGSSRTVESVERR